VPDLGGADDHSNPGLRETQVLPRLPSGHPILFVSKRDGSPAARWLILKRTSARRAALARFWFDRFSDRGFVQCVGAAGRDCAVAPARIAGFRSTRFHGSAKPTLLVHQIKGYAVQRRGE
jgi:hypothetical protein